MPLTEAQHRRRSSAAAYYPDSAAAYAAAAMAGGVDTTPMSSGLHSDEAALAPAPRPQPNLRDGGLSPHSGGDRQGGDEFRSDGSGRGSPHSGGDRQGGDEFRSGGSGRGNPRQRFPFRGRGRRGRYARGGCRGFHLPALSSKRAQDVELSREPAALKEAVPTEVQQATLTKVQKETSAQDVELSREPAALKEAAPAEVQQATLAEVQKATPAQVVELSPEPAALKETAPAEVQQTVPAEVQKETPAQDVVLPREPAALKEAEPAEVQKVALKEAAPAEAQQAILAEVQKATPTTMVTFHGRHSVWCDICRVSCSSLVNLETHKNGKRHQKIKLGLEQFEAHQKLVAGVQATSKEVPPEKLIVETSNGSKGIKRKKPSKLVRVCTLCNAMCETLPTFQAHLGSKKHTGRIKRQKGPDMEYGCVPVPNSSDQSAAGASEAAENIFFGLARRDMLLQQGNGYDGMVTEISPHQQSC